MPVNYNRWFVQQRKILIGLHCLQHIYHRFINLWSVALMSISFACFFKVKSRIFLAQRIFDLLIITYFFWTKMITIPVNIPREHNCATVIIFGFSDVEYGLSWDFWKLELQLMLYNNLSCGPLLSHGMNVPYRYDGGLKKDYFWVQGSFRCLIDLDSWCVVNEKESCS